MKQLLNTLLRIPEVKSLVEAVERGECPAAVTGLGSVHRAQVGAALSEGTGRPLVMVCTEEGEAGRLAEDLETLLGVSPLRLFARELFVRAGTVISRQWEGPSAAWGRRRVPWCWCARRRAFCRRPAPGTPSRGRLSR